MNKLPLIAFVIVLLIVPVGNAQTQPGFVSVKKTSFELNGKPYRFLGTNMWYGVNLATLAEGGDRERLKRELDMLKALGVKNLRIMGASEGLTQTNTVYPPIQPYLGQYDERLLEGMDYLLAEMAKRGMKAVIFLNNFWVWSGGMSQYVSWLTKEPLPNPFKPEYTWTQFMNFSARFYTNEQANQYFHKYIKTIILRKNSISGITYKDDPTIMAWQLANEPRPGEGETGKDNYPVFIRWIKETAAFIKSLDSNHLVSTGNEGLAGCIGSEEVYKEIHKDQNIDYFTFHLWILNWRWYDPLNPEATFDSALVKAHRYLNQHIRFANEIGKPLVLEEFGIPRDGHSYSPQASTHYRDVYFRQIFEWIYQNAKSGGPLSGSNFWTWGGEGRPGDAQKAEWKKGDDFTGDPPQEPQGRNSVFSSDSTTLEILKEFAGKMDEL